MDKISKLIILSVFVLLAVNVGVRGEDKFNVGENCKEVFPGFNGNPNERVNLVFLSFNYNGIDEFLDKVKFLVDPNNQAGSFFTVEPMKSNKNKFNLWYIDKSDSVESSNTLINGLPIKDPSFYYEGRWLGLLRECSIIPSSSKVGIVMLNGNFIVQVVYSDSSPVIGKEDIRGALIVPNGKEEYRLYQFIHDFFHVYARIKDEYNGGTSAFIDNPPIFNLKNCDSATSEVACAKWCKGSPVDIRTTIMDCSKLDFGKCNEEWVRNSVCRWITEDSPLAKVSKVSSCINLIELCTSIKNKDKCLSVNLPYFPFCSWVDEKEHPYFKSQCIPIWNKVNVGTQCIDGTGCYAGCGGNAGLFRSIDLGLMADTIHHELGAFNEKLVCDKLKVDTGSVGGKCDELYKLFGAISESKLQGDFNKDCKVDFSDFLLFVQGFKKYNDEDFLDVRFDVNKDNRINIKDFLLFADDYYGKKC